jgi:hypothetical protein
MPALVRFDVHSWHDLIEMLCQEFFPQWDRETRSGPGFKAI